MIGATRLLSCWSVCTAEADRLDGRLGVYITRFDDQARAAAEIVDKELADGRDRGPLHGLPIGIKDIIRTREAPTTGNTTVANEHWANQEDATVVTRLRQAGAVITGKVTTMELALGVPDESKPFPHPSRVWDDTRWAGGSSSGSAAGVAAGMFLGAVGSDTGGSLRLPAAYCGITTIKPTFGRVPKDGVIPLGNSQDVVGPLARSAEDSAILLDVMSGFSPLDACSTGRDMSNCAGAPPRPLSNLRVGVDRTHLAGGHVDPELPEIFESAIEVLTGLGLQVVDVPLPLYDELTAASIITWNSEAYAYHKVALRDQWEGFGRSVRAASKPGVCSPQPISSRPRRFGGWSEMRSPGSSKA